MTGVIALTRLEILRAVRNRRVMFFTILYPTILFLLIGNSAKGDFSGVPIKTYFLVSMASFGALGAALTTNAQKIAQERKEGWTRQLRLTALPGNGYVIGKVGAATAVTIPATLIVFIVGAFSGVHLPASHWIGAFLVIWLGSLAFTALGIAIGYGVPNDSVQLVVMIFYIASSFLGGLWFEITGALADVGKAFPTYQVRQLATDVVTGQHVSVSGIAILLAWVAGAAILASAMYRRGVTAD
ncbi:MAG: ABC transporter permease [Actinocrinis sp.]